MKQETLASLLGDDWNQKKVSHLEAMEEIDAALLGPLAKALRVTPEAIQRFDEDKVFAIISNTFNDHSGTFNGVANNSITNHVEDSELLAENKRLYEALLKEKDALLKEKDALLKEKDERIALLQKIAKS